jgi:hypothetical protein
VAAGIVDTGFPAERGFTAAFVLGLIATLVALAATVAIPGPTTDPLRRDATREGALAPS